MIIVAENNIRPRICELRSGQLKYGEIRREKVGVELLGI